MRKGREGSRTRATGNHGKTLSFNVVGLQQIVSDRRIIGLLIKIDSAGL